MSNNDNYNQQPGLNLSPAEQIEHDLTVDIIRVTDEGYVQLAQSTEDNARKLYVLANNTLNKAAVVEQLAISEPEASIETVANLTQARLAADARRNIDANARSINEHDVYDAAA